MFNSNWRRQPITTHRRQRGQTKHAPIRFRPALESLEHRLAPATFVVDTIADSGPGSLRQAILDANSAAFPGLDNIDFAIQGSGVQTISPTSALPTITDPVTIDGTTQPGFAGTPVIELNGANALPPVSEVIDGLTITAGNSTVKGLVINRFHGAGIMIRTNGGNRIEGNYIGTDATGSSDRGNDDEGVFILDAPNNTIGGTAAGAGNVISGNDFGGVFIRGAGASGNQVQGNLIGTDASGTVAVGNSFSGVEIDRASGNTVGGTTPEARNIISGNREDGGVFLDFDANANVISGNYIGTDISGTAALGNIAGGSSFGGGVLIFGSNNTVGGTQAGAGNVIAANNAPGVNILPFASAGGSNNRVQGNLIGTNAAGTAALPNASGVFISGANNTVGGMAAGAGNLISGNSGNGIDINGSIFGASGNLVARNLIGTDVTGTAALPNDGNGVAIRFANNITIGGTAAGAGNLIAFNGLNGVDVEGVGNTILSNLIFANALLGIDLGDDGVTANDAGDGDAGSNNLQNFPLIAAADSVGNSTIVSGTINSAAGTTFRVEFFVSKAGDANGFGEGETFLGALDVTTDAGGDASFTFTIDIAAAGQFITATATDPAGNTSEFSNAQLAVTSQPGTVDLAVSKSDSPDPATAGTNLNYTISVANNSANTDALDVFLTDAVPTGTTFVSFQAPAGWTTTTPAPGGTGMIRATIPILAAGATAIFLLVVHVNPSFTDGGTISNTADVTNEVADSDPTNNAATQTTTVIARAELAVTKIGPAQVRVRATITYTVSVSNLGPSDAQKVALTDLLPNRTIFVVQNQSSGPAFSLFNSGNFITDTIATLPPGAGATFTIVALAPRPGRMVNTATVSSATADPQPGDNAAAANTVVGNQKQRWIAQVYLDLLQREVRSGELMRAEQILKQPGNQRALRFQITRTILTGLEYRAKLIERLFGELLRRPPTPTDCAHFLDFLINGGTVEQMRSILLGSAEYFENQGGGTNGGWAAALFQDVLRRPITGPELAFVRDALARGEPRESIAFRIISSTEGRVVRIRDYYNRFLLREPTTVELRNRLTQLASGVRDEDIIASILASPEYFNNA